MYVLPLVVTVCLCRLAARMSAAAGGSKDAPARPLGPDGKPIPGPAEVRQIQAARKMAQQQAQVDEVIGIMHKNVENVLERDRKLGDLEERADALQDGCAQFEKQVREIENEFNLAVSQRVRTHSF